MKVAKSIILPAILLAFLLGCAGTVYIPDAPPPPKSEVKSARPGPNAMWIDGHWSRPARFFPLMIIGLGPTRRYSGTIKTAT